jgi:hypothetical protein
MSYREKYLKYKIKYLKFKHYLEGGMPNLADDKKKQEDETLENMNDPFKVSRWDTIRTRLSDKEIRLLNCFKSSNNDCVTRDEKVIGEDIFLSHIEKINEIFDNISNAKFAKQRQVAANNMKLLPISNITPESKADKLKNITNTDVLNNLRNEIDDFINYLIINFETEGSTKLSHKTIEFRGITFIYMIYDIIYSDDLQKYQTDKYHKAKVYELICSIQSFIEKCTKKNYKTTPRISQSLINKMVGLKDISVLTEQQKILLRIAQKTAAKLKEETTKVKKDKLIIELKKALDKLSELDATEEQKGELRKEVQKMQDVDEKTQDVEEADTSNYIPVSSTLILNLQHWLKRLTDIFPFDGISIYKNAPKLLIESSYDYAIPGQAYSLRPSQLNLMNTITEHNSEGFFLFYIAAMASGKTTLAVAMASYLMKLKEDKTIPQDTQLIFCCNIVAVQNQVGQNCYNAGIPFGMCTMENNEYKINHNDPAYAAKCAVIITDANCTAQLLEEDNINIEKDKIALSSNRKNYLGKYWLFFDEPTYGADTFNSKNLVSNTKVFYHMPKWTILSSATLPTPDKIPTIVYHYIKKFTPVSIEGDPEYLAKVINFYENKFKFINHVDHVDHVDKAVFIDKLITQEIIIGCDVKTFDNKIVLPYTGCKNKDDILLCISKIETVPQFSRFMTPYVAKNLWDSINSYNFGTDIIDISDIKTHFSDVENLKADKVRIFCIDMLTKLSKLDPEIIRSVCSDKESSITSEKTPEEFLMNIDRQEASKFLNMNLIVSTNPFELTRKLFTDLYEDIKRDLVKTKFPDATSESIKFSDFINSFNIKKETQSKKGKISKKGNKNDDDDDKAYRDTLKQDDIDNSQKVKLKKKFQINTKEHYEHYEKKHYIDTDNLRQEILTTEISIDKTSIEDIFKFLLLSGVGVYAPKKSRDDPKKSRDDEYDSAVLKLAEAGKLAFLISDVTIAYGSNLKNLCRVFIMPDFSTKHSLNTIFQVMGRAGRVGKSWNAEVFIDNKTVKKINDFMLNLDSGSSAMEAENILTNFKVYSTKMLVDNIKSPLTKQENINKRIESFLEQMKEEENKTKKETADKIAREKADKIAREKADEIARKPIVTEEEDLDDWDKQDWDNEPSVAPVAVLSTVAPVNPNIETIWNNQLSKDKKAFVMEKLIAGDTITLVYNDINNNVIQDNFVVLFVNRESNGGFLCNSSTNKTKLHAFSWNEYIVKINVNFKEYKSKDCAYKILKINKPTGENIFTEEDNIPVDSNSSKLSDYYEPKLYDSIIIQYIDSYKQLRTQEVTIIFIEKNRPKKTRIGRVGFIRLFHKMVFKCKDLNGNETVRNWGSLIFDNNIDLKDYQPNTISSMIQQFYKDEPVDQTPYKIIKIYRNNVDEVNILEVLKNLKWKIDSKKFIAPYKIPKDANIIFYKNKLVTGTVFIAKIFSKLEGKFINKILIITDVDVDGNNNDYLYVNEYLDISDMTSEKSTQLKYALSDIVTDNITNASEDKIYISTVLPAFQKFQVLYVTRFSTTLNKKIDCKLLIQDRDKEYIHVVYFDNNGNIELEKRISLYNIVTDITDLPDSEDYIFIHTDKMSKDIKLEPPFTIPKTANIDFFLMHLSANLKILARTDKSKTVEEFKITNIEYNGVDSRMRIQSIKRKDIVLGILFKDIYYYLTDKPKDTEHGRSILYIKSVISRMEGEKTHLLPSKKTPNQTPNETPVKSSFIPSFRRIDPLRSFADIVEEKRTMLPTDGTMLPTDGTMLPTDGTMLPTDGTMLPTDGTMLSLRPQLKLPLPMGTITFDSKIAAPTPPIGVQFLRNNLQIGQVLVNAVRYSVDLGKIVENNLIIVKININNKNRDLDSISVKHIDNQEIVIWTSEIRLSNIYCVFNKDKFDPTINTKNPQHLIHFRYILPVGSSRNAEYNVEIPPPELYPGWFTPISPYTKQLQIGQILIAAKYVPKTQKLIRTILIINNITKDSMSVSELDESGKISTDKKNINLSAIYTNPENLLKDKNPANCLHISIILPPASIVDFQKNLTPPFDIPRNLPDKDRVKFLKNNLTTTGEQVLVAKRYTRNSTTGALDSHDCELWLKEVTGELLNIVELQDEKEIWTTSELKFEDIYSDISQFNNLQPGNKLSSLYISNVIPAENSNEAINFNLKQLQQQQQEQKQQQQLQ